LAWLATYGLPAVFSTTAAAAATGKWLSVLPVRAWLACTTWQQAQLSGTPAWNAHSPSTREARTAPCRLVPRLGSPTHGPLLPVGPWQPPPSEALRVGSASWRRESHSSWAAAAGGHQPQPPRGQKPLLRLAPQHPRMYGCTTCTTRARVTAADITCEGSGRCFL
jgi:hypothetical protein